MCAKNNPFSVGFGRVDITPPSGFRAGGLDPVPYESAADPLMAKALYASDGNNAVVVVGVDLVSLGSELCEPAIGEAVERTGLNPDAVLISCSHTHSGPYTNQRPYMKEKVMDEDYVGSLPGKIADSIEQAVDSAQPATFHLGRSLVYEGQHHRRVIVKRDGLAMNTWMRQSLNDLDAVPQVLGTDGPIDPEMWVARFDTPEGRTLGVLVNFSLHPNSKGGREWSADYPGVIAERIGETFGQEAVSVFTPGACANVNPTYGGRQWRAGAERIAAAAVEAAGNARSFDGPIYVGTLRHNMEVKRRDPNDQREGAIERLNWSGRGGRADVFQPRIKMVEGMPELLTLPVNAARIGPLGIATNPGELFVEWGLDIKRRSPFPHTVVTELTNDSIGYQPDREAFELEGYETLVGPNKVALEGIQTLTDGAVDLLQSLWEQGPGG